MSRRRFQNISTLENLKLFKYPAGDEFSSKTPSAKNSIFGSEIRNNNYINGDEEFLLDKSISPASDDSLENLITEFRDLGTNKSSSSSLSWGSEYFNEATKKIRDELERMDRVLRGVEPIPDNYDRQEYEDWMKFFPDLKIFGDTHETQTQESQKTIPKSPKITKDWSLDVQNAVIDEIYTNLTKKNNTARVPIMKDAFGGSFYHAGPPIRRQQSSRSLISSQISSSRWLKDDDTLPYLGVTSVLSGRDRIRPTKGILKNSLVLPPIDPGHLRSVSATNARTTKSLSAISEARCVRQRFETGRKRYK